MKKATIPEEKRSQSHSQHTTAPTLIASVLRYLLHTGSLNKYEAVSKLSAWSLNSTISDLWNHYGVSVTRTKELVGRSRQPVCRYSVEAPARRHALDVLALMDGKGKQVTK
jgi:hypothetical protein